MQYVYKDYRHTPPQIVYECHARDPAEADVKCQEATGLVLAKRPYLGRERRPDSEGGRLREGLSKEIIEGSIVAKELIGILDHVADRELRRPNTATTKGGSLFHERLETLAEFAVRYWSGDMIEIGCYAGDASVRLARVAKEFGRTLICVDNWDSDQVRYDLAAAKKRFFRSTSELSSVVVIIEGDAHSPEVEERLRARKYCFAVSDDGHRYHDHLSELTSLLPVTKGLVAVDDVHYPEVKMAIRDAIVANPGWTVIYRTELREAWLVDEKGLAQSAP